jgi:hypothetical protein
VRRRSSSADACSGARVGQRSSEDRFVAAMYARARSSRIVTSEFAALWMTTEVASRRRPTSPRRLRPVRRAEIKTGEVLAQGVAHAGGCGLVQS